MQLVGAAVDDDAADNGAVVAVGVLAAAAVLAAAVVVAGVPTRAQPHAIHSSPASASTEVAQERFTR